MRIEMRDHSSLRAKACAVRTKSSDEKKPNHLKPCKAHTHAYTPSLLCSQRRPATKKSSPQRPTMRRKRDAWLLRANGWTKSSFVSAPVWGSSLEGLAGCPFSESCGECDDKGKGVNKETKVDVGVSTLVRERKQSHFRGVYPSVYRPIQAPVRSTTRRRHWSGDAPTHGTYQVVFLHQTDPLLCSTFAIAVKAAPAFLLCRIQLVELETETSKCWVGSEHHAVLGRNVLASSMEFWCSLLVSTTTKGPIEACHSFRQWQGILQEDTGRVVGVTELICLFRVLDDGRCRVRSGIHHLDKPRESSSSYRCVARLGDTFLVFL